MLKLSISTHQETYRGVDINFLRIDKHFAYYFLVDGKQYGNYVVYKGKMTEKGIDEITTLLRSHAITHVETF